MLNILEDELLGVVWGGYEILLL